MVKALKVNIWFSGARHSSPHAVIYSPSCSSILSFQSHLSAALLSTALLSIALKPWHLRMWGSHAPQPLCHVTFLEQWMTEPRPGTFHHTHESTNLHLLKILQIISVSLQKMSFQHLPCKTIIITVITCAYPNLTQQRSTHMPPPLKPFHHTTMGNAFLSLIF